MSYFSPFHLIYAPSEKVDPSSFPSYQKIKQRVLARYELGNNEALEIEGKLINKGEAIDLIQILKNEEDCKFHFEIFSNPMLLAFMEKGKEDFLFAKNQAFTEEFKNRISEDFAAQFGEVLLRYIKGKQKIKKLVALSLSDYINDLDFSVSYQKTYSYLKSINIEIEDIREDEGSYEIRRKALICSQKFSPELKEQLNILPEYFEDVRESFATNLVNVSSYLNNTSKDYTLAFTYIKYVNGITCSDDLKKLIRSNYTIVEGNTKLTKTGSSWFSGNGSSRWGVVGVPLFVIFIFARIIVFSGGCNKHDYNDFTRNRLVVKNILQNIPETSLNSVDANIRATTLVYKSQELKEDSIPENGHLFLNDALVSETTKKIHIRNNSSYDGVLFLRTSENYKSSRTNIFIRKGDSITFDFPCNEFSKFMGYFGEGWNKEHCVFCNESYNLRVNQNVNEGKVIVVPAKSVEGGIFIRNPHMLPIFSPDTVKGGDELKFDITDLNLFVI